MKTILVVATVSAAALLAGCTATPTFDGKPAGGIVQEHGHANPTPLIWPTRSVYAPAGY